MKLPAASLFGMVLLQQCQRADGLHDVEFLAVGGGRVTNGWTGDALGRCRWFLTGGKMVKPVRKQFSHRESSLTAINPSVKRPIPFGRRAALLVGNGRFIAIGRRQFRMAGEQPIEIAVAWRRFHVEEQRLSLQVDLDPKDRFDAGLFAATRIQPRHANSPVSVVRQRTFHVVGESHNRGRGERGIQKRIMAVDPQWDVTGHGIPPAVGFWTSADGVSAQPSPPVPAEPPVGENHGLVELQNGRRPGANRQLPLPAVPAHPAGAPGRPGPVRCENNRHRPSTISATPGAGLPAVPSGTKHGTQSGIDVRFKIGWLDQALAHLILPMSLYRTSP